MVVYVVAAIANLAVCVPLASAFGATGAAVATAATVGAANLVLYWDVRRLLSIDPSVIAAFRLRRDW
jgi:O-antigen/teichoic acid export membrane protein